MTYLPPSPDSFFQCATEEDFMTEWFAGKGSGGWACWPPPSSRTPSTGQSSKGSGGSNDGVAFASAPCTSKVRRTRYESVPFSMMWARSVIRSSKALQRLGFGNTRVHSENQRLVVTLSGAGSALSAMTWNRNPVPISTRGT